MDATMNALNRSMTLFCSTGHPIPTRQMQLQLIIRCRATALIIVIATIVGTNHFFHEKILPVRGSPIIFLEHQEFFRPASAFRHVSVSPLLRDA
jgi:hypothetical protein